MNMIELCDAYTGAMNEVYVKSAASAAIESDPALIRKGANGHELLVPKFSTQGMAEYSRSEGYVRGGVSLEWETVRFNYERGRSFEVDVLDNAESQNTAFGRLASEFMKKHALPELDAFRFAELCSSVEAAEETISTGAAAVAAIRVGAAAMDDRNVPNSERYLFISNKLQGLIDDMDTTKSKAVLERFAKVITVPKGCFYSAIDLYDGVSEGQEEGGFAPADGSSEINFLIVHRPSVIVYTKYEVSKVIPPELNPDADAWRYAYRSSGYTGIPDSGLSGVYASIKG